MGIDEGDWGSFSNIRQQSSSFEQETPTSDKHSCSTMAGNLTLSMYRTVSLTVVYVLWTPLPREDKLMNPEI